MFREAVVFTHFILYILNTPNMQIQMHLCIFAMQIRWEEWVGFTTKWKLLSPKGEIQAVLGVYRQFIWKHGHNITCGCPQACIFVLKAASHVLTGTWAGSSTVTGTKQLAFNNRTWLILLQTWENDCPWIIPCCWEEIWQEQWKNASSPAYIYKSISLSLGEQHFKRLIKTISNQSALLLHPY